MKVLKKRKSKKIAILKIVVFLFCAYVVATIVNQQMQISKKKAQLSEINEKIALQDVKNQELKEIDEENLRNNENYIEKVARETLCFAKQGERIFVNITGK